jgi:hypothetical protein
VYTYESNLPTGCSVTGGFVYRGATFPLLYGKYIYADYCSGKIWSLEQNESNEWINTELFDGPNSRYVSFGEDNEGELYLAGINGDIYQIRDITTPVRDIPLQADLKLRPNPFDQEFWVEGTLPESGRYRLQLLSAQGQQIWERNLQLEARFQQKIDTEDLPKGLYLFRLEKDGASLVRKLIKE